MRKITDHKVNGLNEAIEIVVKDEPGPGGANHVYQIDVVGGAPDSGGMVTEIRFQNGPVKEAGLNGISNEALIAIVIDRIRGFQGMHHPDIRSRPPAPFACRENAIVLTRLDEAMMWLQKRTRDRMARGVEGTNVQ